MGDSSDATNVDNTGGIARYRGSIELREKSPRELKWSDEVNSEDLGPALFRVLK